MAIPKFSTDIRPLFRDSDVEAMKPNGIDLSSYQNVKERALDIYAAVSEKAMPCDGAWDEGKVKMLKEWIDEGMQP